jgi:hypothetical protein
MSRATRLQERRLDAALGEIDSILPELVDVVGELALSVSSLAEALDKENRNGNGES